MNTQDDALTLSNPRLLSAVYFSLLAIIATIVAAGVLHSLGAKQIVPLSNAIFLSVAVAVIFGALFGKGIVISEKPYKRHVFFLGFLMVVVALPLYNIGIVYFMREHHAELFAETSLKHLVYLYLFVLMYSFILAGVWLAILAGIAALYLRGYVVYFILHALSTRRGPTQKALIRSTIPHQHNEEHHGK